jgi:hypothetical protein
MTNGLLIYWGKYLRISSYIRKPFLIHDFATAPVNFPICEENLIFFFISVLKKMFNSSAFVELLEGFF